MSDATTSGAGASSEGIEAVELDTPRPRSRKGVRAVAGVAVIALLAAGAGVLTRGGSTRSLPRLRLNAAATGSRDSSFAASAMPLRPQYDAVYHHSGAWPQLQTTAPVYQLQAADLTAAQVDQFAAALGLNGPTRPIDSGWQVDDGDRSLVATRTPMGWSISMYQSGSAVSGSGGGSTGDSGNGDATAIPPSKPTTGVPADGTGETTPPTVAPPANLPSASEAETIARAALTKMGVLDGTWVSQVSDGASVGIASSCPANAKCIAPVPEVSPVVYSRSVTFHRIVDGLDWYVEVGDGGSISNVSGTLSTLDQVGDYPLRPVADVFDDIVAGKLGAFGPMPLAIDTVAPDIATADGSPTPAPLDVELTGVEVGSQLWFGNDGTSDVAYLIPTYRFTGTVAGSGDYPIEVLALDQQYVAATVPTQPTDLGKPVPQPAPSPAETDPGAAPTPSSVVP